MNFTRDRFLRAFWTSLLFMSLSQLALAQGIILSPGTVVNFEFSSLTPATYDAQGSEGQGYIGLLRSPVPRADGSFQVDVFGPDFGRSFRHNFEAATWGPEPTASFGWFDWGKAWVDGHGTARITYISGPPIELLSFALRQSMFVNGKLTPFELRPIPEPSSTMLMLLAAASLPFALGFVKRRGVPQSELCVPMGLS